MRRREDENAYCSDLHGRYIITLTFSTPWLLLASGPGPSLSPFAKMATTTVLIAVWTQRAFHQTNQMMTKWTLISLEHTIPLPCRGRRRQSLGKSTAESVVVANIKGKVMKKKEPGAASRKLT